MDIIQDAMTMIAKAGEAKSIALEALSIARSGKFSEAHLQVETANAIALEGNKSHASILFSEAQNDDVTVTLFLIHAADHLNNSNTIITLVNEMIKNMEVSNNV